MKQFLLETWQLWYWAFFRPSLLQARMNAWEARGDEAWEENVYLLYRNGQFAPRFALLVLLLCMPLIVLVASTGETRDWLFVLIAVLTAYGLSVWLLPIGLQAPLLFMLVYAYRAAVLRQALDQTLNILPPLPQLALGIGVSTVGLVCTFLSGYWLWQRQQIMPGRIVLVAGSTISVVTGSWLATRNWLVSLILGGIVVVLTFLFVRDEDDPDQAVGVAGVVTVGVTVGVTVSVIDSVVDSAAVIVADGVTVIVAGGVTVIVAIIVAVGVAVGVAGGVAVGMAVGVAVGVAVMVAGGVAVMVAGGVAVGVAGGMAGIALLPLLPLLLASWLVGIAFSGARWRWWGWLTGGVMAALAFEQQGGWALAVGAITLAGCYRLLPFYPALALISIGRVVQIPGTAVSPGLPWLYRLPPHSGEILWLPLPGHSHILAAAWSEDAPAAFATLQQMWALPYPGYQRTVQQAIPQIVADQMARVQSINSLITTAQPENRLLLSLLVPQFYQDDNEQQPALVADGELVAVMPRLLSIARDIGRAFESFNPVLVERGLEHRLGNLRILHGQLPGLGLRESQVTRWQPVFVQWETILQQAIAYQRTLSQGEVPNPFQTGNPLRLERKELFKGRTQFVNDVLRYVYDASRPTLVLHGPRRCGKTSFLLNLPRLLPGDVLPVYYSLQNPAATASIGDFCYGLVRSIGRDLQSQGIGVPEQQRQRFHANPYVALEDWLDATMPRLGQRSILLCFDEFEQLGSAIAQGRVDINIFDQLRELIQHSDMAFLFCGVQTLADLGPNWSSYFISVQPMEMTYLEPDEARELLINPDPAFDLRYDQGIVEHVVAVTRCQPYLLQLIGEQMVRQANQHQTRLLTEPLLVQALDRALTAGEPYFTNLWIEYTGSTPDEVRAGQVLLHAIAHSQPLPPVDTPAAQAALRRLLRYHIVEQIDGGYRCEVPLVARWVCERAVLEDA